MKIIFNYIASIYNNLINLFTQKHIMDNIFITNITHILNNAFTINGIQCDVTPQNFTTNHSGTIKFTLPHQYQGQSATIEIKLFPMGTQPPKLYFELISCTTLYFPYMSEIWFVLSNSGIKPKIINEWNTSCIRNNTPQKIVNDYY